MEARFDVRRPPHDPRAVLFAVTLLVLGALVSIRGAREMGATLAFVCAWHTWTTGSIGASARSLARVVPFALLIVVLNAMLVPGEPIVSLAGRRLASREGAADGVFFALRLGVMLMSVSALLAAVDPECMARGVHDLLRRFSRRVAASVAFFTFVSMGFAPLVAAEFQRIRVAQAFRGGDFSGSLWRRAESARAWLVPLLTSAIHRSGQVAMAVELRHVRERLVHTIDPPRTRAADWVLVAAAIVVVALASRRP
jgi:energy-coupling factor transporter transmembrane protein EcfT